MSEKQSFYKESAVLLEGVITEITARLEIIRKYRTVRNFRDPIETIKSRVKTEESMKEKLKRKGFPVTLKSALENVYDAAGIRVICTYLDDVYMIADMLKKQADIMVISEKDYIKNPKPNGYRSYHLILSVPLHICENIENVYIEIQIRTIAMDCWASLEHQMKYKKDINNQQLIVKELKRCADEIASTDIDMQMIWNMIHIKEQ